MNEKYTYHQINQQEAAGYDNPTILVPHGNGRISVGRKETINGKLYAAFEEDGKEYLTEAQEGAFSDQAQAFFANELALDAGRDAEAWEPTGRPEVRSEAEIDKRLVDEMAERIQGFKRLYSDAIDNRHSNAQQYVRVVDELSSMFNQHKYGSLSKDAFSQSSRDILHSLRASVSSDMESDSSTGLGRDAAVISEEVETVRRSLSEEADDARAQLRSVGDAFAEIAADARALSYVGEEALEDINKLLSVIDSYSIEQWGYESYQAHIVMLADQLSEALVQQIARSGRIKAQFEYMK